MVLTKPFEEMAKTVLAFYETDRSLPAVILDHPTQNLSPEELPARSVQLADAAMRLLDGLDE